MPRSLTLLLVAAAVTLPAPAADLDLEVRGIKTRSGQVHAALFANAEDFSLDITYRAVLSREGEINTGVFTQEGVMPRAPTDRASAPAHAKTVHLKMTDIEPGEYTVAAYQDVNDDGKLDTDFSGRPSEPWGMSNNPRIGERKPTWEEGRFVLPPEGIRLIIELR